MKELDEPVEDRLFLIEASRIMGEKIPSNGVRRLDIIKEGLKKFCADRWPTTYYDIPLRIGIVAFSGRPGKTSYDTIVPQYPTPTTLEIFRLDKLSLGRTASAADGLEYAYNTMSESLRQVKRIEFICSGELEGPDPLPVAEKIRNAGIKLNCIQISDALEKVVHDISIAAGGSCYLVKTLHDFARAIE